MIRSLTILIFFISTFAQAQVSKECFDAVNKMVDENSSTYCVVGKRLLRIERGAGVIDTVFTYRDTVVAYFTGSRQIKFVHVYNHEGVRNGNYVEYHPNGRVKERGNMSKGIKTGIVSRYYADGKIQSTFEYLPETQKVTDHPDGNCRILNYYDSLGNTIIQSGNGFCSPCHLTDNYREMGRVVNGLRDSVWSMFEGNRMVLIEGYKNGKFLEGTRYDVTPPFHYTRLRETGQYINGNSELLTVFLSNWKSPGACYRLTEVKILLAVDENGRISSSRVLDGKNEKCDAEILKVANLYKKFYPARERGKPVKQNYIIPINFNYIE